MNEIEKAFYNAFINKCQQKYGSHLELMTFQYWIEYGKVIGPYKVDFLFDKKIVVEIDGHDYHKTKEQRDYDYKRERYLMKNGYFVVRFMGTEVFLTPEQCIEDLFEINSKIGDLELSRYYDGFHDGQCTPPMEDFLAHLAKELGAKKDA